MNESMAMAQPPGGSGERANRLQHAAILVAVLAMAVPFLFAPIPPLTDLPGHLARFAISAAPAGSPLHGYYDVRWLFTLNLGTDLIVAALAPAIGVQAAVWLIAAAIPVITAAAIVSIARASNPRGAAALPWALIFVFGAPLLWGFLNYVLAAALSLVAFALWLRGGGAMRLALMLIAPPVLLLVHGVGGLLFPVLVSGDLAWRLIPGREGRRITAAFPGLLRAVAPLAVSSLTMVLAWRLFGSFSAGGSLWDPGRKLTGLIQMVRDQNMAFDIATVVLAGGVAGYGWATGARFRGGAGPVLALLVFYLIMPTRLGETDMIDVRLAPLLPMLALALQDWSGAPPRAHRTIFWSGAVLLALRLVVTTIGFADYSARYTEELAALDKVPRGARVLNLTVTNCPEHSWRQLRIEHVANLASARREAWVNAQWALDGVHPLSVRYRPSGDFFRDPSHLVWEDRCVDLGRPYDRRSRHALAETLPRLPLEGAEWLWLIGGDLPPGFRDPRLMIAWRGRDSALYAIHQPLPVRQPGETGSH